MADHRQYEELTKYLRSQGQSEAEIELILARVRQYEIETQQDSVMDAIGDGSVDLAALVREALGDGA